LSLACFLYSSPFNLYGWFWPIWVALVFYLLVQLLISFKGVLVVWAVGVAYPDAGLLPTIVVADDIWFDTILTHLDRYYGFGFQKVWLPLIGSDLRPDPYEFLSRYSHLDKKNHTPEGLRRIILDYVRYKFGAK